MLYLIMSLQHWKSPEIIEVNIYKLENKNKPQCKLDCEGGNEIRLWTNQYIFRSKGSFQNLFRAALALCETTLFRTQHYLVIMVVRIYYFDLLSAKIIFLIHPDGVQKNKMLTIVVHRTSNNLRSFYLFVFCLGNLNSL